MAQPHRKFCMSSTKQRAIGVNATCKDVRFSPTSSPMRRSQSLNVDNSNRPKPDTRTLGFSGCYEGDILGYVEQSRLALSSQRLSFERERAAFAEERKLWDKERAFMKRRITHLEDRLRIRRESDSARTEPPPTLRETDEMAHNHHVWEGSSPSTKPTRIFPEEEGLWHARPGPQNGSGDGLGAPPSLDEALSPRSRPADRSAAVSVPIELLDSSLDGITLKSTALPPDVVAKVSSPSPLSSPSHISAREKATERRISKSQLLACPEDNLTRDAGHTPRAIIESDVASDNQTPGRGYSLAEEAPLAPRQTLQHVDPSEPEFFDLQDDPALQGPLGLQNDENKDLSFLQELDKKLLGEAHRIVRGSSASDAETHSDNDERVEEPEVDPEIRFRKATNFGTAFGSSWNNP